MDTKSKAAQHLTIDLLENILSYASNPGQCGEYITSQVRGLVGTKIVALMQAPVGTDNSNYSITSVCPARFLETVKCQEIQNICRASEKMTSLVKLSPAEGDPNASGALAALNLGDSVIIPLMAGEEHIGVLLLLDLLSSDGVGSVIEALQSLAGVIGLVLKNSRFYQQLDLQVAERTLELEKEISERKLAEQALQKSEISFRTLAENMPGIVYRVLAQDNGRMIFFSDALTKVTGYKPEELNPGGLCSIEPYIHPEDLDRVRTTIEQANKAKTAFEIVYRFTHKNGETLHLSERGKAIFDSDGTIASIDGIIFDITKQKKAEEKLKLTQFAVDYSYDEIFWINEQSQFVYANKAAEQKLGYSTKELLSLTVSDVDLNFQPETWPSHWQELKQQKSLKFETEQLTKDGSTLPVEIVANYLEFGDMAYNCAFARDISDRKRAEAEKIELESQLRQAHKMEAIGTMAGGIAHDFNNILGAIIGYAEMAKDDIPLYSHTRQDIEQILKAGNRAKDLVQHILTFSRMRAHTQGLVEISIDHIVKEVLKFQRSIIPTSIEIESDIDEQCGRIMGDSTQIHQILMNLCTNAAHAMEANEKGVLKIGLHKIDLSTDDLTTEPQLQAGPFIQISVSDTGTGIKAELIDRVFDPYFTTKEVGKGSGMGLAVAQGIVKNHGGFIKVESGLGKGTTFNVFFPKIEKPAELDKISQIGALPTGTEKILFIDDEEMLASIGKATIEKLGYTVTAKTDSQEAFDLFRSDPNQFDLIITDQTMPKITGSELAKQVLEIRPDLPIILCTGYSSMIDEAQAQKIGITEYTLKPVKKEVFATLIRKTLDRKKAP